MIEKDIFKCAEENDVQGLQKLINNGVDVNATTYNKETPLHVAALHGSNDVVKLLIEKKANIQAQTDYFNETPLHNAVQEGQFETVQLLLDSGADPNAVNIEGESPLFTAVRYGYASIISLLASKNANLNARNNEGTSVLEISLTMTSVKTVKALLDSGVDINIPGVDKTRLEKIKSGEITDCNEEEEITEEEAANESNEPAETSRELINQLLEKKLSRRAELSTAEVFQSVIDNRSNELNEILADIDVNVTIFDDETLLHAAVYNHSVESIPILLEKGANVDAKTATVQESPLQIAVQENMVDVITLLLDNNADIETTNIDNETPLFTAIRFGRKEAFDLLLEKNAKYDIVNNEGCTPLIVAIQLHRKDMALKLLKLNADLTIGNENPVLIAQNSGELEIVDMISNKNPNLRVKSRCASRAIKKPVESPVYDAIKSKNYILLRRLLAKPIELNIDDPKYGIPLFKAIEAGSLDCVKLLLRAGADIEFRVNKTAIEQAIESKHRDIVEYLIEEGADLTETDKNSENPVFYAVRAKDASLVELVINRGSSVNVVNYSNMSPLYVAVGLKQKDVIQVLLKYHADPNNTGLPCLRLAKQLRDQEIMDILSKNGAATEMKRTAHSNRVRSQLQSRTAPIKARNLPPPKNEECMICKKKNDLVKLIPCGHQLACKTCLPVFAEKFQTCPICKVALFACKT